MEYLGKSNIDISKIESEFNVFTDMPETKKDIAMEIIVNTKSSNQNVGKIVCFFYSKNKQWKRGVNYGSMCIKSLGVQNHYRRKGIAIYLMLKVIDFAEKSKIRNITVNPVATRSIIQQEQLEQFYRNFRFDTFLKKQKNIEIEYISD